MRSTIHRIQNYHSDIKRYLLYTLLANVAIGVFSLVFNLYLLELGQREDYIGLFNGIQTLAMAGTAVIMGRMIERIGIWGVVFWGLVSYLIASVLLSIVTEPVLLLLMSALWGAGTALVFTPVMPFLVALTRNRQRQEVAAVTMSLVSFSTMLGSLVGGYSPVFFSTLFGLERPGETVFRATMITGVVIAAFALIPLLKMTSERKRARPVTQSASSAEPAFSEVTPSSIRWRMIVYISVGALMALGGGAVFPFYNVFLQSIGASAGQIGLVFASAWAIAAGVGLFSPWIATRLGSQRGSVLVRLAPAPFFLILIFYPHLWFAVMIHVLRISSISMSWSMESSFISNVLPARAGNSVFGYRSAAWNVGFSISSLLAGGLIVRYGYGITFGGYAFFMALAMGTYYFYFRGLAEAAEPDEEEMPAAAEEPLPPVERVTEDEIPASLPLAPGRGDPLIVSSVTSDEETSPLVEDEPNAKDGS
ncbi:MAG: MFS transporter [Chloroflexota bacterium]